MGAHRVDALPLLDEHQPVGVLDIDMAVMRQTPRLTPRPRAMLGAERNHALAMLGGQDDVADNEDLVFIKHLSQLISRLRMDRYDQINLWLSKYTINLLYGSIAFTILHPVIKYRTVVPWDIPNMR